MREAIAEWSAGAGVWLAVVSLYVVACTALVFGPLAFFRSKRILAGRAFFAVSYLPGLAAWLLGAGVTFGSFGWFGLIVGLLVLGVGVVPLGIIGAIWKLDSNPLAAWLAGLVAAALIIRSFGLWLQFPNNR